MPTHVRFFCKKTQTDKYTKPSFSQKLKYQLNIHWERDIRIFMATLLLVITVKNCKLLEMSIKKNGNKLQHIHINETLKEK